MQKDSGTAEDTPSVERATAMAVLPSDFDSLNSDSRQDETVQPSPAQSPSDDGFVLIQTSSSQKGTAMKALSSILNSEKDDSSIDGDWVALSSPAMKVHALGDSKSPSDSSTEASANASANDDASSNILSYDKLRTTSTDPALDIDPTKRETYLCDAEFQSLFRMSKEQFYTLPKWKQAQRKLDLDLF